MKIHNIVSISGGKDSTALGLLALEREPENLRFVFADTGHEHPLTLEYVEYLDGVFKERCGIGIETVRADFTAAVHHKRHLVETKWRADGIAEERVQHVLEHLHPTGNPFLDLCLAKGRFPNPRMRFCSHELKGRPIDQQIVQPVLEQSDCAALISWRGVRADESRKRAAMQEKDVEFGQWEPEPRGHLIYRPLIKWTAQDVFAMHAKHNIEPNPLYKMGMTRVGCMPCIHARKSELKAIAINCPEELDRVEQWEKLMDNCSKKGEGTFYQCSTVPRTMTGPAALSEGDRLRSTITAVKEWALTSRGGRQFDLVSWIESQEGPTTCSSVYGLCE